MSISSPYHLTEAATEAITIAIKNAFYFILHCRNLCAHLCQHEPVYSHAEKKHKVLLTFLLQHNKDTPPAPLHIAPSQ